KVSLLERQAEEEAALRQARARMQPNDPVRVPRFDKPGRLVRVDHKRNLAVVSVGLGQGGGPVEGGVPGGGEGGAGQAGGASPGGRRTPCERRGLSPPSGPPPRGLSISPQGRVTCPRAPSGSAAGGTSGPGRRTTPPRPRRKAKWPRRGTRPSARPSRTWP